MEWLGLSRHPLAGAPDDPLDLNLRHHAIGAGDLAASGDVSPLCIEAWLAMQQVASGATAAVHPEFLQFWTDTAQYLRDPLT